MGDEKLVKDRVRGEDIDARRDMARCDADV
jgi:hypothetical protein